ncbi:MAG TPA: acyl-CoA dehydrogenase family protein [Dehalococcoidia bacterium]|nr:acyl-CoA dehydrogenase family protein [Dehalococcoidia bacterium]
MDFQFTRDEEAFRGEVRGFLDRELPAGWDARFDGSEQPGPANDALWAFSRGFTHKLAASQWLAMAWPKAYGGLEAPHMQQLIYNEEMAYRSAPGGGGMGVAWVGPAIMLYGTDAQKQRFLPRITSGEDVWCTLYSEPGAGSDLAALQTRAVADGDDFVINGQKIWTSGAHRSNWGWLAARTDPDAPKHKGISTFVVPMDAPGVSIRPLINIAGHHGFNEVFFENVRIPKDYLVGEQNRGWYQVAVALDFERSGIAAYANGRRTLETLAEFAKENPETTRRDPGLRLKLADRAVELNVGTQLAYRIPWMQSQGKIPNHEASMSKLYGSELSQRIALTGIQLLGQFGSLKPGSKWAKLKGRMADAYESAVSATIAAGTSEIQRGIIAGRGLGLPRG